MKSSSVIRTGMAIACLILPLGVFSQLSGVYNINAAVVTGGSNFQSFSDAASALHTFGVNGPVTFVVAANSGPYYEQVKLDVIPGASASNTVSFLGNGNTITYDVTNNNRYLFWLKGAKHVRLENLVLRDSSTLYGFGILLNNGADYNTIKNCTIDLSSVTNSSASNSAAIVASADSMFPSGMGNNANFCTIENNLILGGPSACYTGIRLNGNFGSTNCEGNVIRNNCIQDVYAQALYLSNASNTIIEGNEISRPTKILTTTFYAMFIGQSVGVDVFKNKIHNTHDQTTFSVSTVGIYLSGCMGTAASPIRVYNNLMYNINCDAAVTGIYVLSSNYVQLYYNTVSLDFAGATTVNPVRGFSMSGASNNIDFKNNLISITQGGPGEKHATFIIGSSINMDHNAYHLNPPAGTNYYVGNYGAVNYQTLSTWQTANGGAFDANSVEDDPIFVAPATGNYTPNSGSLDNKGMPIPGIATDINALPRNVTTPDPGAFEFSAPSNDAGIVGFSSPIAPCPGMQILEAVVKNFGALPLDSVTINWSINGIPQSPVKYINTLQPGQSDTVILGNVSMAAGINYDFISYTAGPNGNADAGTYNDTTKWLGRKTALSGVFTIGPAGNYPSVIAAANDLNTYGVCGPVVFNVASGSGPYNGRVSIGPVSGVSAVNTVTFNGNGTTIAFNGNNSDRATIVLKKASHFTFNGFVVKSLNATNGYGFFLTDQSNHNMITNCTIDMTGVTSNSSVAAVGIYLGSAETSFFTTGLSASNCLISNNTIQGGMNGLYYGIIMVGGTGTVGCENNQVIDNNFNDVYSTNINLQYTRGTIIRGNDFNRATKTNVGGTFMGVYITTGNVGVLIEKNRFHDTHTSASNLNGSAYGVYINNSDATAAEPHIIRNNLFYKFNGNATDIGIQSSNSDYVKIYYNTISFNNTAASNGMARAIYTLGFNQGLEIKNNLLSVTKGGGGDKHGLYLSGTGTIDCDYNNIHVLASNGGYSFIGNYNNINYGGLPSWQTIAGGLLDQHSRDVNPQFTDIVNNDYTPKSSPMNNGGTPIPGITVDILGAVRHATNPDFGAIEYTAVPENDSCHQAILITAGITHGTTVLSTSDFAPACVVVNDISGGVWYKYKGKGDFVTASLCNNTNFNSQVRVFTGTCGNLTCVTGNNDSCAAKSMVEWCAEKNVNYYLLVYGYAGDEGEFEMELTEVPIAKPVINASGPTTFCPGGEVILSSSTAITYQWNDPTNSQTKSVAITKAGSYQVITTDNHGCQSTSNPITVSVFPEPFVDLGADFYFCMRDERTTLLPASGTGLTYLWSTGETTSTIIFDAQFFGFGKHTISLTVTDVNGCKKTDEIVIDVVSCTGVEGYTNQLSFKLYPNPNDGRFVVEAQVDNSLEIIVRDGLGRSVYQQEFTVKSPDGRYPLDLPELNQGVYQILLRTGSQSGHQRFVVE